jgi:hypothetical protein
MQLVYGHISKSVNINCPNGTGIEGKEYWIGYFNGFNDSLQHNGQGSFLQIKGSDIHEGYNSGMDVYLGSCQTRICQITQDSINDAISPSVFKTNATDIAIYRNPIDIAIRVKSFINGSDHK